MRQTKGRRGASRKKKQSQRGFETFLSPVKNFIVRAVLWLRSVRIQRRMRRMQMIERLVLGNKHSVTLLRVDNQEFIVGCCGESMVLLGMKEPTQETMPQVPTKEDLVQAFQRVQ